MGKIPQVGEPAPFFAAATDGVERYSLDVAAGRWIVLMFFGTMGQTAPAEGLALALERRELFNGADAAFFGVSIDPADRDPRGLANSDPGVRFFWDFDLAVTRLYGAADAVNLQPCLFLIDPAFRIAMSAPIEADHPGAGPAGAGAGRRAGPGRGAIRPGADPAAHPGAGALRGADRLLPYRRRHGLGLRPGCRRPNGAAHRHLHEAPQQTSSSRTRRC